MRLSGWSKTAKKYKVKEYYEGCLKRVAPYPHGTWNRSIHTCIELYDSYTLMYTCAHKSNGKIDNFPIEYTQSLTTVVKMVGKSVAKKGEIHKSLL